MKKKNWNNIFAKIILSCAAICSLTACFPVMLASGAVGGSMAAIDRRTVGAQTEDRVIQLKGENTAYKLAGDQGHVSVTCYNRKVLLTGEAPSEAVRQSVNNAISKIENVQSVENAIVIAAPSSLTERSSDALITTKVTATFIDDKFIISSAFKTVTERGVVYLMGRVTREEGDRAAKLASGVEGVKQVVKVFEYISQDELQRINTLGKIKNSVNNSTTTDTETVE